MKHYPQKYAKDLRVIFPAASSDAIDFLRRTLKFNPQQRITLDECLAHPFIAAYSKREQLPLAEGR